MKFRSFSNRPGAEPCPPGSSTRKIYRRVFDSAGNSSIEFDHEESTYQAVQLAARGTLTKDLVARSLNGDDSAISPPFDSYADITNAPKSLLEAENSIIKAREIYDSLPADVKSRYNNNFSSFLTAVSDGTYMKTESELFAAKKLAEDNAAAVAKATPPISDETLNYIKNHIGGTNA